MITIFVYMLFRFMTSEEALIRSYWRSSLSGMCRGEFFLLLGKVKIDIKNCTYTFSCNHLMVDIRF